MKKIILLSLLWFVGLAVQAQEMSVKSFKLLPDDSSALQESSKKLDQNGQIAALIKVVTTERGFGFEGGALGIVDVKQMADQVCVWVPYGLRKITIKHPLFGILRDYRFPVEIQSGKTYEMVLDIEKSVQRGSTELTKQFLSFRVTPKNATLEVEDEVWPLDEDGVAERVVDFGKYHYRVYADNYQTDAGIAKVNDPDQSTSITVELLSTSGWIEFVQTPSTRGAEAYVDHAKIGKVPCTSNSLSAGTHEVELRRIGYSTLKQNVTIKEGETLKLNLEMKLEETATFTVNGETFVMKRIPEGTFMMGGTDRHAAQNEKPVHQVTVSTFFMGETEVTQALWNALMNENPSTQIGNNLPVHKMSWNDCQSFITKLNKLTGREFRLPTEAEWEYAARGGTTTSLYNGQDINIKGQCNAPNFDPLGWYSGNCGRDFTTQKGCDVAHGHDISEWPGRQYQDRRGGLHPVKQKQPNAYGLYDMLGNVFEWCNDWYGSYENKTQRNPTGPASGDERVTRSGSWYRDAEDVRVSYRNKYAPNGYSAEIGLRLVLTVDQDKFVAAEEAMREGQYGDALENYRQVYETSHDEALLPKINLADVLKTEFDAIDMAIKYGQFDGVEAHFDNILKVDPTNAFVEGKRSEVKQAKANYKKNNFNEKFRKATKGFRGSWEKHDNLGGLHFEVGANLNQFGPYTEKPVLGYRGKLSYGYYKAFPIVVDVNSTVYGNYQSLGGGIGSAFTFTDRFAFNYGVGWQKNWYSQDKSVIGFAHNYDGTSQNFYYSLGLTYMFTFDEEITKRQHIGLNYTFNHSFGNAEHPVSSHSLSCVFSDEISLYLGILATLIGLGMAGYIMKH